MIHTRQVILNLFLVYFIKYYFYIKKNNFNLLKILKFIFLTLYNTCNNIFI